MAYELWDVGTGNCIGRYAAEEEALARVMELLGRFGRDYAADLELAAEDDLGTFLGSQSGAALVARAQAVLAPDRAQALPTG